MLTGLISLFSHLRFVITYFLEIIRFEGPTNSSNNMTAMKPPRSFAMVGLEIMRVSVEAIGPAGRVRRSKIRSTTGTRKQTKMFITPQPSLVEMDAP
jgi:hypothetical protein